MPPLAAQIAELRRQVGAGRFLDLALEVQAPDGSAILRVGGVWDHLLCRFADRAPVYHVVRVTRAQEKAARQLAAWFEAYERDDPERVALEVYVDLRRGGKTFFVVLAVLAFLLRYPRTPFGASIGWLVTPTYPQQRELHDTLAKIVPRAWLRDGRTPDGAIPPPIKFVKSEKLYKFATGAVLEVKSADHPESMKAGGVSFIAVNEAQQLSAHAVLHCLGNNIDSGGATVLAMNPPNSVKGLWAEDLHDAINAVGAGGEPLLPWARETEFPASQNEHVNQAARRRFSQLARVIDPKQEQRDAGGLWVSIKDRAYPLYNRGRHFRGDLVKLTAGWRDITGELNSLTGYLMAGDRRGEGIGMDFQWHPYSAAVKGRALVAPAGNALGLPPGTVVYALTDNCTNDPWASNEWWSEEALCREMIGKGWDPKTALVIGDGTGNRQGASGRQRGANADPSTFSFPIVRHHGFEIHGPIERVEMTRRAKQGAIYDTVCSNPPVPLRLNAMLELFGTDRILIGPEAADTAEAFRICEARSKRPFGRGAHLTDAAGYLLWKWETCLRDAQQHAMHGDSIRRLLTA